MLAELDELELNGTLSSRHALTIPRHDPSGYVEQEPAQSSPDIFHDTELLQDEGGPVRNAAGDLGHEPELQHNQVSRTQTHLLVCPYNITG